MKAKTRRQLFVGLGILAVAGLVLDCPHLVDGRQGSQMRQNH